LKDLKEWFAKEIKRLLIDEGSPTLRIPTNIFGSFLILALYIRCTGWIQGLKAKHLQSPHSLAIRVIELTLTVGTTALIVILISTSIWSLVKQRMPALARISAKIKGARHEKNGDRNHSESGNRN
jgi:hypothetical protein